MEENNDKEYDELMDKFEKQAKKDLEETLAKNKTEKSSNSQIKKRAKEALERGLITQISNTNKGYQMLMKMGYQEGKGLGVKQNGRLYPLEFNFKRNNSGLGYVSSKKNMKKARIERILFKSEEGKFYRGEKSKKFELEQNETYIKNARMIVENIESRLNLKRNKYWPKIEEEEDDDDDKTCEKKQTVKMLNDTLNYLRNKHNYCFWCQIQFKDGNDMKENCPGFEEAKH